ncbi:keratin-associated protein 13-2-like protein [Camelus ferus]|nr:keratin-associated protein 13-2-like protein [Camelus ferus]
MHYPGSSCGSSYPSNLVCTTDLCSPSTCQLSSSLYRGCQETCCEPTRCHVMSSPCQTFCYCQRTSLLCSPASQFISCPGFWVQKWLLFGYGSRSLYLQDCRSMASDPWLGIWIPYLGLRTHFLSSNLLCC